MRARARAVLAIVLLVALAGCNTVRGMGEDIQALGRGIQKAFSK